MLLNIVTDEELLTSQIIKTILLILLAAGIPYNFYRVLRSPSGKRRIINGAIFIFLSVALFFVFREYRVEEALLKKPEYVTGTTLGYCEVFAKGRGIEFEYEAGGRKYRNCNTYHPVSKDSILVPGGKYQVRFSKKFAGKGRMNFRKRMD